MKLVIGDKNLSSWSMRAWLVAKASGISFEEVLVLLDRPETEAKLKTLSPTGRVPCLIHGDIVVWDSLAIAEYLAELAPNKNLWPQDTRHRALARSYVAEMHSGFSGLRDQLSMDLRLRIEVRHLTRETVRDIQRILQMWSEALKISGGPFLFGSFGIADAFFAPVAYRFLCYGVHIQSQAATTYMEAIFANPHVISWYKSALDERPYSVQFSD